MKGLTIRFPVTCALCARELLMELPVALVAEALVMGLPIRLQASCHDISWDATQLELEQIREYLGVVAFTTKASPGGVPHE